MDQYMTHFHVSLPLHFSDFTYETLLAIYTQPHCIIDFYNIIEQCYSTTIM